MATLWWKFTVAGLGSHFLRVRGLGTAAQEVLLDGSPVDAPPGTTKFTGPGAVLLELQETGGEWSLFVDGAPVEAYIPDASTGDDMVPVIWWKFCLPDIGTHHVRVKNIGCPGQEIWLDGSPIDAPAGTMAFTGPGGVLAQLEKREGMWALTVDGHEIPQCGPQGDTQGPAFVWHFTVPSSGSHHQVCATNVGTPGQTLLVDGVVVPAPPGQVNFTGPAGSLLELQGSGDSWNLLVDGVPAEVSSAPSVCEPSQHTEGAWTFLGPQTGLAHQLKAINMGMKGQKVYIDGTLVAGPEGQTAFTGPGGVLLELKARNFNWELSIDGLGLEDHNTRVSMSGATAATGARAPVSSGMTLPQGVSHDPVTGKYTANLRIKGRFKSLGEFDTPDEASVRYLQEKTALGEA